MTTIYEYNDYLQTIINPRGKTTSTPDEDCQPHIKKSVISSNDFQDYTDYIWVVAYQDPDIPLRVGGSNLSPITGEPIVAWRGVVAYDRNLDAFAGVRLVSAIFELKFNTQSSGTINIQGRTAATYIQTQIPWATFDPNLLTSMNTPYVVDDIGTDDYLVGLFFPQGKVPFQQPRSASESAAASKRGPGGSYKSLTYQEDITSASVAANATILSMTPGVDDIPDFQWGWYEINVDITGRYSIAPTTANYVVFAIYYYLYDASGTASLVSQFTSNVDLPWVGTLGSTSMGASKSMRVYLPYPPCLITLTTPVGFGTMQLLAPSQLQVTNLVPDGITPICLAQTSGVATGQIMTASIRSNFEAIPKQALFLDLPLIYNSNVNLTMFTDALNFLNNNDDFSPIMTGHNHRMLLNSLGQLTRRETMTAGRAMDFKGFWNKYGKDILKGASWVSKRMAGSSNPYAAAAGVGSSAILSSMGYAKSYASMVPSLPQSVKRRAREILNDEAKEGLIEVKDGDYVPALLSQLLGREVSGDVDVDETLYTELGSYFMKTRGFAEDFVILSVSCMDMLAYCDLFREIPPVAYHGHVYIPSSRVLRHPELFNFNIKTVGYAMDEVKVDNETQLLQDQIRQAYEKLERLSSGAGAAFLKSTYAIGPSPRSGDTVSKNMEDIYKIIQGKEPKVTTLQIIQEAYNSIPNNAQKKEGVWAPTLESYRAGMFIALDEKEENAFECSVIITPYPLFGGAHKAVQRTYNKIVSRNQVTLRVDESLLRGLDVISNLDLAPEYENWCLSADHPWDQLDDTSWALSAYAVLNNFPTVFLAGSIGGQGVLPFTPSASIAAKSQKVGARPYYVVSSGDLSPIQRDAFIYKMLGQIAAGDWVVKIGVAHIPMLPNLHVWMRYANLIANRVTSLADAELEYKTLVGKNNDYSGKESFLKFKESLSYYLSKGMLYNAGVVLTRLMDLVKTPVTQFQSFRGTTQPSQGKKVALVIPNGITIGKTDITWDTMYEDYLKKLRGAVIQNEDGGFQLDKSSDKYGFSAGDSSAGLEAVGKLIIGYEEGDTNLKDAAKRELVSDPKLWNRFSKNAFPAFIRATKKKNEKGIPIFVNPVSSDKYIKGDFEILMPIEDQLPSFDDDVDDLEGKVNALL